MIAAATQISALYLIIFDTATGEYLTVARASLSLKWSIPWFTQDGSEGWCHDIRDGDRWGYGVSHGLYHGSGEHEWVVAKDSNSNVTALSSIAALKYVHHSSGMPPWQSSHGHQVTDDGWILSSSGKRLLLLPHHWQSSEGANRMWSGQFLAFLYPELQEVVTLELLEG